MSQILLYSPHEAQREALLEQLQNLPYFDVHVVTETTDLTPFATAVLVANLADGAALPTVFDAFPCLTLGGRAGDALARPVRWAELEARLHLLLDRLAAESAFAVGAFMCLPLERVLLNEEGGEQARLTDKEVQILRLLSQSPDPVPRAEMLEKVWGYKQELETHTLETHIYRLRQKLEENPTAPRILITVENGYTLAAL